METEFLKYLDYDGLATYDSKIKEWVHKIPYGEYRGQISRTMQGTIPKLNIPNGPVEAGWWYLLTNTFLFQNELHAPGDVLYCVKSHTYDVKGLIPNYWVWLNNSREYKMDTPNTTDSNFNIIFSDQVDPETGPSHSQFTGEFTYNPKTKNLSGVNSVDGLDSSIEISDIVADGSLDQLGAGQIHVISKLSQVDGKLNADEISASVKSVCPLSDSEIEKIFDQDWGKLGDTPVIIMAPLPIIPLG